MNKWVNYGKWRHGKKRKEILDNLITLPEDVPVEIMNPILEDVARQVENYEKNKMDQIINEEYEDYLKEWSYEQYPNDGSVYNIDPIKVKQHTREQFEYRIKTDIDFFARWSKNIPYESNTIGIGPFSSHIAKILIDADKKFQKDKKL
jgi:hypothetical protein